MQMLIQNIRFLLMLLLLMLGSMPMRAQVTIPDPNMRQFIMQKYPSALSDPQTLDTIVAATFTGSFECNGKNISNAEGVQYFKGIDRLFLKSNNLTTLPDLKRLSGLLEIRVDTNQITHLPELSSLTNLQFLSLRENKLTQLPSLANLSQLYIFFCDNNQLTSLPDLSSLTSLGLFIASDNPIKVLPDFNSLTNLYRFICTNCDLTYLPDLSNCTSLTDLIVGYNKINQFPDLSANPIQILELQYNSLKTMPNLSAKAGLTTLRLENNNLSYEDIVPTSAHPSFANFKFNPQYPGIEDTIQVVEMENLTIDLGFDAAQSGSTYTWYKDAVMIGTTPTNKLTINSVSPTDAGVYSCIITNSAPKLSAITLYSRSITVVVLPCINTNGLMISYPDEKCEYPIQIQVDESSIIGGEMPYTYSLKNTSGSLSFTSPLLLAPKEGKYDLEIKDNKGCTVLVTERLHLIRNENCDPIFYPNGDGVADSYYIEIKGKAKIYNREGEMIRELITPAHWDGTTDKGKEAPTGLYVIVVNESITEKVTLIR